MSSKKGSVRGRTKKGSVRGRTKKGSVRGRTNSTSSNGNRPSSSSNSAPSPMSADQYAMDLGFTMVTRSRTRSFGIRVGSPTESSTLPRPLVNLIHPSEDEEQVDPEYDLDDPFLDSQPM
ncbi:hypothetical protein E5676_scaffold594G00320 [Cucumis melo var. makuwa]|uniref:Uncharacterized protein n=1 Tax=Cucumis melo var. makuwa TaxID=1194695 RepID=A0A5D3C509_CUCMM|nr:hypothetical protein E6C27_scaffold67G00290 [Cucumis melo var. makuwa]TYK06322.1 hypothetical protein E5676_scaffold594G00320 [Cucumis melo var. makuwa]